MSTQIKKAKEIKKMVDLYGIYAILKGGAESCKPYPYDNKERTGWNWPKDNGCGSKKEKELLLPGTIIDRFGSPYGSFLGIPEESYRERALPYMTNSKECNNSYHEIYQNENDNNYHQYIVTAPKGLIIEKCKIAPAFDKKVGGILQYMILDNKTVMDLLKDGLLCEISKDSKTDDHLYYCKYHKKLTDSNYPKF